jgi:hypothetical protein
MPARPLSPQESAFQEQTKLKLGKIIYRGDGDIYRILGYPNRLVKIVPTYGDFGTERLKVLKYLQRSKNPAVVKLHRVGIFSTLNPEASVAIPGSYRTQPEYHYYYYVMDRLTLLPRKGRTDQVMNIGAVLEEGERLNKGTPRKVQNFIRKARKLKYQHHDIHEWNIMQDKRGSLKFIDLESFMY